MSPDGSRRALLRGAGLVALSSVAGCLWGPVEEESNGGPGSGPNGGSNGGSNGDSNGDDGNSNGGSDGTTAAAGRTYSFEVRNRITSDDLESMPHVDSSAKTELTIEAARSVKGEEDPVLFGKTLTMAPESSRTFEDAFTTETNGDTYVVTAEIAPFVDHEDGLPRDLNNRYRFTPGQFNTPDDDVFVVRVFDAEDGMRLEPTIVFE